MRLFPFFSAQTLRNVSWSGLAAVANPLAQLAVTPFLLHSLGAEVFGVWILLSAMLAIVGTADLGLSPATTLFVSRYRATDSRFDIRRVAQAALTLVLLLVCVIVFFLATFAADLLAFFGVTEDQTKLLSGGFPFLALAGGLLFLNVIPASLLRGYERYDLEGALNTLTSLATAAAVCATVYLGGRIPEMLVAQASVFAVSLSAGLLLSASLIGSRAWLLPYCSFASFRELCSVSVYGWIQGVSSALFSQADRLIVSAILGPASLAFYGAAVQVAQAFHSLMARSLGFLFPRFTALQNNKLAKLQLFNRAMFATTLVGSTLAVSLFLASPWLLNVWLGQQIPADLPTTLSLLAIINGFMATTLVPGALMFGAGQFRLAAIFALLSGLIVSSTALLLVPVYGLLGAALAKFTFLPVSMASRVFIYHHAFGSWSWSLGVRQLLPAATALAPSGVAAWLLSNSSLHIQPAWVWQLFAGFCGLALMWIQCRRQYGSL